MTGDHQSSFIDPTLLAEMSRGLLQQYNGAHQDKTNLSISNPGGAYGPVHQ